MYDNQKSSPSDTFIQSNRVHLSKMYKKASQIYSTLVQKYFSDRGDIHLHYNYNVYLYKRHNNRHQIHFTSYYIIIYTLYISLYNSNVNI